MFVFPGIKNESRFTESRIWGTHIINQMPMWGGTTIGAAIDLSGEAMEFDMWHVIERDRVNKFQILSIMTSVNNRR
jgi:hypothetical protein